MWLDAAEKIYEDEEGKSFDPDDAGYDNISDWFENRHSKFRYQLWNMGDTALGISDKDDNVKKAWLESMDLYDESDTAAGEIFRG